MSLRDRFDQGYMPEPNSGCWLWIKSINADGYGEIRNGADRGAHRASWKLHYGPIPEGLFVCHKCDVRCCVNPDHLFLGTCDDNVQDAKKKGRRAIGDRHPLAKLTYELADEIRASPLNQPQLAAIYGVNRTQIGRIRRNETWMRPIDTAIR